MFLQSMREKTQSWVAYVIVGLLILSFALWGISSYFGGSHESSPAATVGGEDVPYTSFVTAYHRFIQDSQAQNGGKFSPEQDQYAKQMVLKSLVERLAIIQYIKKNGFAVDQQQIDSALMAVPLFSDNGEFSPALFKRFLAANNVSGMQFIADFSTRMTVAQWEEGIRITSFSTPVELANIVSLLKQKREIVYSIIKANEKSVQPISSEAAESFYNQHQPDFTAPEQVKLAYVALHFADIQKSINPSDEVLTKYYTQDSARYNTPERWQVDVITVRSPSSSAADVSAKVSSELLKDDTLSSFSDAKIEQHAIWLASNNLSRELISSLAQTKENATTAAFKTGENTYMLYKLIKHQPAVSKKYAEVKSQVRMAYVDQEANKQWTQIMDEVANLSYEHPDSLNPLAEKLKLKIQTTDFFSKSYDGKGGLASHPEIVAAAFSDDVVSGGNNSDVIKLDQGKSIYVLRVVNHEPAHEKPFAEVKDNIKQILLSQAATQKAKEKATDVKKALEAGDSIKSVQSKFGIILSMQSVGRFDEQIPGEILQQAFMLPLKNSGVTKMGKNDFAVVQVLSITPGKISSISAKERAMYQNVVENEWAQAELFAYVRAIMSNTKVKLDEKALSANA